MLVLGLDSSLPLLSVALLNDEGLVGAVALRGKDSRNEKLLPAVDWLLAESGIARSSIDLFAVTRGPGSFTGVRIGLATVQGLALALGRPVCAMSTHEAVAFGAAEGVRTLVYDEAGRGEFYVSTFVGHEPFEAPHLCSAAELESLRRSTPRVVAVPEMLRSDSVAALAAARAHEIRMAGRLDGYGDATPIYVRLAEAEVKLQQRRDV
jgi:tRNA threonylcarbamoyladenosine biosynthesis protein TsaB